MDFNQPDEIIEEIYNLLTTPTALCRPEAINMKVTCKKQSLEESIDLPKKRKERPACPICDWTFPSNMTEDERNEHAECCLSGKGVENKELFYKASAELKKLKKEYKRKKQMKEINEEIHGLIDPPSSPKIAKKATVAPSRRREFRKTCKYCNQEFSKNEWEFRLHKEKCKNEHLHQEDAEIYKNIGKIPKHTMASLSYMRWQNKKK